MLAMLNYAIDPRVLSALVPTDTELDVFEGRTYISLIGFRFLHTRVRGIWIPFHSDFDEVNLRTAQCRGRSAPRRGLRA